MTHRPINPWAAAGLVLLAFPLIVIAARAEPSYIPDGANACLDCHENSGVLGILETRHADGGDPDTPAAQKQCQSCHGPSSKHVEFPIQVANLHFGEASNIAPKVQNQQCLECHENGEVSNWHGSAHGFEDILCSSCHSLHQPDRIIPEEADITATCNGTCHVDLMKGADASSFTHAEGMALKDGTTLNCSTCHNPHGSLESTRCLECHEQTIEVLASQGEKAQRFHRTGKEKGTECIRCHKGLAHPISRLNSD